MDIENFFLKSVGEWNSMRSGHSLAFQEFEEIRSKIKIIPIKINDSRVIQLLEGNLIKMNQIKRPFLINWEANSEWGYDIDFTNIHKKDDPIYMFKAMKNKIEISNMIKAHISDGAALTKFIFWIN